MLVSLDDSTGDEDNAEIESDLTNILREEGVKVENPDSSVSQKFESLMDRFMHCFASLQATTSKNQRSNNKKFKLLESAHNTLATKVASATSINSDKIESLENQLKDSISANTVLARKVELLVDEQARQRQVNETNTNSIKSLGIKQGFIIKNVNDCHAEVKERKMIISGVAEFPGENVTAVALGCINKVIQAAINLKHPNAHLGGLKKMGFDSIDNVFRIGKAGKNRKRNISITFVRVDAEEMVFKAKSEVKDDNGINFFLNDDTTLEGRTLKSKLKHIVSAANMQGRNAKLAGNRVVIDSRSYSSNELNLLPKDIIETLKQEKEIDDGIIYRGEYSTFSNFFPAPFSIDGIKYAHVEQHYQSMKALHHNEPETAERIMNMSNPLRIKVLGDGIDSNDGWIKRRMLVLYDGVRAKFEQNLTLHDELLSTEGKHLYEATTDSYFGCGIGFDSKKWQSKDWPGENVAGLVVRKVRDELLGIQPDVPDGNNTLAEIATQEEIDIESNSEMDTGTSATKESGEVHDNVPPVSQDLDVHYVPGDSDAVVRNQSCSSAQPPQMHSQWGRGKGRGKGKNRGRGQRGASQGVTRHPLNRPNAMSDADRDFLGIKESAPGRPSKGRRSRNTHPTQASTPRPKMMNWTHLTESQKKGLAKLGLTPDLISAEGFSANESISKV